MAEAGKLPGGVGSEMVGSARDAFMQSMELSAVICALIAVVTAMMVAVVAFIVLVVVLSVLVLLRRTPLRRG